jgi:hypothetical protein
MVAKTKTEGGSKRRAKVAKNEEKSIATACELPSFDVFDGRRRGGKALAAAEPPLPPPPRGRIPRLRKCKTTSLKTEVL